MPLQFTAQLRKSDYAKFRRYAMFRMRKQWLISVAFALFFAWAFFPKDYASTGAPFIFAVIVMLLLGAFISLLILFVSMFLVSVMPNRPGSVLGQHTFTLTDAEFQEVNDAGSATVKLNILRRYETTHYVFLLTPTHVGYILPKRDLQLNPEFLKELRERTKGA